jgi:uncharacterized membrane protein
LPTIIGWPLCEGWIALSLILYVVTGLFWLPVVWIQVRLRDLARAAATAGEQLPAEYSGSTTSGSSAGFRPSWQ